MCVQIGTSACLLVEKSKLKLNKPEEQDIEDVVDGEEIDERTIKEVAANLRIIADEINTEYSRMSLGNIVFWIRIMGLFRWIWIGKFIHTLI